MKGDAMKSVYLKSKAALQQTAQGKLKVRLKEGRKGGTVVWNASPKMSNVNIKLPKCSAIPV